MTIIQLFNLELLKEILTGLDYNSDDQISLTSQTLKVQFILYYKKISPDSKHFFEQFENNWRKII